MATLRYAHSEHVDLADIGAYHAELYGSSLDRLVDLNDGALDPARVSHTQYAAFVAEPLDTVRAVLDGLGIAYDSATEDAMRAHLRQQPRAARGEHRYSFGDLGLSRDAERKRFARYQEHFDVVDEELR